MAPNVEYVPTGMLYAEDIDVSNQGLKRKLPFDKKHELEIVWRNVIWFAYLHLGALYGAYLMFTEAKWQTIAFAFVMYQVGGIGITAGVHRLFSHRAFKVNLPLKIFLVYCNTVAFQNDIIDWARDHRVHHKYSETDADPHNQSRGFFFAHMGWLTCRKHPDVAAKGREIDISDLTSDPVLAFQRKYYFVVMPLCCFIVPTLIPMYFWGETFSCSWHLATLFRYTFTLHMTWLVNSLAHTFGNRPYDTAIAPAENLIVTLGAMGEGWHNFHHTFPWDYRSAELGNNHYNISTWFIDFFAKIGWAWDMRTVSPTMIKSRVERTGDGTHPVWGWGDKDMTEEHKNMVHVVNRKEQ